MQYKLWSLVFQLLQSPLDVGSGLAVMYTGIIGLPGRRDCRAGGTAQRRYLYAKGVIHARLRGHGGRTRWSARRAQPPVLIPAGPDSTTCSRAIDGMGKNNFWSAQFSFSGQSHRGWVGDGRAVPLHSASDLCCCLFVCRDRRCGALVMACRRPLWVGSSRGDYADAV